MQDSTLLTLALIVAIVGVAALYLISRTQQFSENPYTADSGIIKFKGTVLSAKQDSAGTKLMVQIPIEVRVFNENISLRPGQTITISGEVQEYQGKKSIVASEITT